MISLIVVLAAVLAALGALLIRRAMRRRRRALLAPVTRQPYDPEPEDVFSATGETPGQIEAAQVAWYRRRDARAAMPRTPAAARPRRYPPPPVVIAASTEEVLRQVEALQRPRGIRDSHVYFIQCGDDGPTKVGRAIDVRGRLGALQTANAEGLHLVAVIPFGGSHVETALHRSLNGQRVAREWFRLPDPVDAARAAARTGASQQ